MAFNTSGCQKSVFVSLGGEPRFYQLNQDYLAADREIKLDHLNVIKLFAYTDTKDFR